MQRLLAFKFELMPTSEQIRNMRRFGGACRFVFNKALALQKETYEAGGKYIGYVAMARHLTFWRGDDLLFVDARRRQRFPCDGQPAFFP